MCQESYVPKVEQLSEKTKPLHMNFAQSHTAGHGAKAQIADVFSALYVMNIRIADALLMVKDQQSAVF